MARLAGYNFIVPKRAGIILKSNFGGYQNLTGKGIPVQPNNGRQLQPRAAWPAAFSDWNALAPSVQDLWNAPGFGGQSAFIQSSVFAAAFTPLLPNLIPPSLPYGPWAKVVTQGGSCTGPQYDAIPPHVPPRPPIGEMWLTANEFPTLPDLAAFAVYTSAPLQTPIVEPDPAYPPENTYPYQDGYFFNRYPLDPSRLKLTTVSTDVPAFIAGTPGVDIAPDYVAAWGVQPVFGMVFQVLVRMGIVQPTGGSTQYSYPMWDLWETAGLYYTFP